jgi:preprotein translocase subunit SecA
MFQQMMGSIREETVGFLFNLEVEVAPQAGAGATIQAKGLGAPATPAEKLSYTAPSDSATGEAEVRNQRGQLQQAATQRMRRAVAESQSSDASAAPQAPQGRGAFGQATDGAAPANRAERRAQERKGR